jgi:hypothetical protein
VSGVCSSVKFYMIVENALMFKFLAQSKQSTDKMLKFKRKEVAHCCEILIALCVTLPSSFGASYGKCFFLFI